MAALNRHMNKNQDDFETSESAYRVLSIGSLKGKVVWDPFFCSGAAGSKIKKVFNAKKVLHHNKDFFDQSTRPKKYDVIITNPPFSLMKKVLEAILATGKPYAILMRTGHMNTKYFKDLMKGEKYSIVFPIRFMRFEVDGVLQPPPAFQSAWLTNLPAKKQSGNILMTKK